MAKISVVIPFYRPPKLNFRRCIESVLSQTYNDIEIILVSDGNGEDYNIIANEYCIKDKRCKLIIKENGGVSSARNLGIKISNGEYIAFIDADDWIDSNYVYKLHKAIQDADISICGVGAQYYFVHSRWEDKRLFWSQPSRYNGIQYINFCANKMFKMSIIKQQGLFFREDISLGEDAIFLNSYYKFCQSIRCISDTLYYYEYNNNSAVFRYNKNFWYMEVNVIEIQWDAFHQYALCENEENAMVSWLYIKFKNAFNYYMNNEKNNALLNNYIQQISKHSLFYKLISTNIKNNPHLNRNDKLIIRLWSLLGINGIKLVKRISKIKRLIC